jgi:hypothetical protein
MCAWLNHPYLPYLPTLPTFPTSTHLTDFLTYLTYLTYPPNLFKTPDTVLLKRRASLLKRITGRGLRFYAVVFFWIHLTKSIQPSMLWFTDENNSSFIDPDRGDKVNSGIELSFGPARLDMGLRRCGHRHLHIGIDETISFFKAMIFAW